MKQRSHALAGVAVLLTLILPCAARAQNSTAVLTGQYNSYRTGANVSETTLTPSNVSPGTFGLLFTQPVDADIFAQPLYVPGLTINGALHNVAFVATSNNSVYAFDADTPQPALWQASLGTPVPFGTASQPTVGILGTPVIDIGAQTLFVVTFTSEGGAPVYRLHALNLLTGAEITNIVVQGAVAGTGDDSQSTPCASWNGGAVPSPCVPFKAGEQLQRTSLLEDTTATTIYLGFGTLSPQEATEPYHGWLIGYHYTGSAFTQSMIFISSANATQNGQACSSTNPPTNQCGHGGGIWMSGRGPASDSTGIYVVTGNGGFGGTGTGNWSESALRLESSGEVEDSFTPFNYAALNRDDLDLGDGGTILFSSSNVRVPNLALVAGKTGAVSVLNRANMGGLSTGNAGGLQTFYATTSACGTGPGQSGCYEIHSPALWNRASGDSILYVWAYGDVLRVWDFDAQTNSFQLDANQGTLTAQNYPGGGLAVSANANSDGIVWAIVPTTAPASQVQGTLYAFDATNVSTPLWASTDYWLATKFTIPTVANGRVYVPTSSPPLASPAHVSTLRVYGLCGKCAPPVTLACAANAGQVGTPYSSALAAAGGVPPYTFSITGGSLPPGLTLNSSTGVISGAPTIPGSFPYTIQVADSTGRPAGTATSTCGITIAPAPVALACPANASQVGAPYSSALAAIGGVPPYTFSLTVGLLPPGLTLNSFTGAIDGTPTTDGSFTFTAQAVDSTGTPAGTATGSCGIAIVGTFATSTTLSVTPNPVGLGQPVTLTAQVSPAPSAGRVTFYDGAAVLDSVAVAGGSASLTTSLPTAAVHMLRAWYGGNPSYASSASSATALAVTALPSSTLLPATPYLANGAGTWVAVGDFNGDGHADFVVANLGVSVWLGNGDGTFQAPVNSAGGASPIALATGDFNGDGLLDVAAVYASGGVAMLLGNGDGTFQAAVNYAVGSGPSGAAVADFNGDGVPDLAVANAIGVAILLGNGDGTFQAAVNYTAGSGPAAVAAGDFIGNGKADLAVVNAADGTVSVLLGNGDGTFQPAVSYAVGADPQAVSIGDLNGDGRPDLVVANNAANSVSVLLGNGDGTFQAAAGYAAGANPQSVAVADINGDGLADVVVADAGSGNVGMLLGNGDGTLQTAVAFGAGNSPVSLALADFNGDSRADVVAAGGGGNTAEVLLGGQAATSVTLSASPNPSTVGQPLTLTGSVTPAAPFFGVPAGTLTFSDNGTALPGGTVSLSGGVAGYATSSLAVGTHAIGAAYSGNGAFLAGTSAALSETVNQAAQTIAFGNLPNQTYGAAPFTVNATASSGLAVSFASTTTPVCTVAGSQVTLAALGACTIQATQAGNTDYAAATPVNQSFQVTQESQTITFGPLSSQAYGTTPFTVSATASSGLTVRFNSETTRVCTVSGTTVSLVSLGTCTIQASQPGNVDCAAAPSVSQSFQVTQGSQTITFGPLSNPAYGAAPFTVGATASSDLTVRFSSQTTRVCKVSGNTLTLVAVGACTIQATQAGNADYAPAAPVDQSFLVTQGSQTITFGPLSNQTLGFPPFTLSATANSGLAVSFSSRTARVCAVSGTTVTLAAVGTCMIQAAQPGNADWAAATPVDQSFQVTQ